MTSTTVCGPGVAGGSPDGDDPWGEVLSELRRRFLRSARQQVVDDAVQDAALVALRAASAGAAIEDRLAFCTTVVRRRLVDEHRKKRPTPIGEGLDAFASEPRGGEVDWLSRLRREGLEPPQRLGEVLARIACGLRSTKRLARAMGRDPKSVRRMRGRLQSWLSLCCADLDAAANGVDVESSRACPPRIDQSVGGRRGHVVRR